MKVIIDADACPVIDITIEICTTYHLEVILVSDFNHDMNYEGVTCIQVAQKADSSDHKIFSIMKKGDIIITSDGGLANLVLGKQGIPISFSGFIYTLDNIDQILMERYLHAKARKAKQRFKNIPKRTDEDDKHFISSLIKMIEIQMR